MYRLILIGFINILSLKILCLTTQHEKMLSTMIIIPNNLKNKKMQEILFTLVLGSKFLETICIQIKNIHIADKIRGNSKTYHCNLNITLFLYLLLIKHLLNTLNKDILHISYSLSSKDIKSHKLYLIDFYRYKV
uniref:Uncharacterized protein n=1 Tax=Sporolithon durum TaxID=48970 RepID=A0A141SCU6_9FLOR|nr:hypothetical protein Sdur_055 [Sporolithon durum]AMK96114.1 hypothetical protein Sdur_055 [Sporolithon durum]